MKHDQFSNRFKSLLALSILALATCAATVPVLSAAAGSTTSATPTFGNPTSVAVAPSGVVYVADAADRSIKKLSADGALLAVWRARAGGLHLQAPAQLAVDGAGHVYVLDGQELANGGVVHSVVKLSPNGRILARFTQSSLRNASLIAASHGGIVTVVVPANGPKGYGTVSRFIQLSPQGKQLASWKADRAGHDFADPTAIAVDRFGAVYAALVAGSCDRGCQGGAATLLEKFSAHGTHRYTRQDPSGGADVTGIAVDKTGAVYLALVTSIEKLSPSGAVIADWGAPGCGPRLFRVLSGLAMGSSGPIYVTDTYNRNLQKLSPAGDWLGLWGGCPSETPPTPMQP